MRGFLLTLGAVLGLVAGAGASAQQAPATVAGQISAPDGATDVDAGQVATPARQPAAAPRQLTPPTPRVDAPPPLSSTATGHNTAVAVVKGADRCDPVTGAHAGQPDCARIVDSRADEFATPSQNQSPSIVNPDTGAAGLVDGIVNGGTGSVVELPPK